MIHLHKEVSSEELSYHAEHEGHAKGINDINRQYVVGGLFLSEFLDVLQLGNSLQINPELNADRNTHQDHEDVAYYFGPLLMSLIIYEVKGPGSVAFLTILLF